jgi:hypothetical protein
MTAKLDQDHDLNPDPGLKPNPDKYLNPDPRRCLVYHLLARHTVLKIAEFKDSDLKNKEN